jgi:hypothetical protein
MPGSKSQKFERCLKDVKRKGVRSPGAVCAKSGKKHAKRTPKKNLGRKRRNPESSAVAAYVDTHGKEPSVAIDVDTPIHYHKVIVGMGKLISIIFAGGRVKEIKFGKGTYLGFNEKRTQLFVVGGDQSVNLRDFGIKTVHESEILGEVKEVVYFTEKLHLIEKDGGKGPYGHKFSSPLPTLVYDTRNKLLSFSGGGYTIPAEGIDG